MKRLFSFLSFLCLNTLQNALLSAQMEAVGGRRRMHSPLQKAIEINFRHTSLSFYTSPPLFGGIESLLWFFFSLHVKACFMGVQISSLCFPLACSTRVPKSRHKNLISTPGTSYSIALPRVEELVERFPKHKWQVSDQLPLTFSALKISQKPQTLWQCSTAEFFWFKSPTSGMVAVNSLMFRQSKLQLNIKIFCLVSDSALCRLGVSNLTWRPGWIWTAGLPLSQIQPGAWGLLQV